MPAATIRSASPGAGAGVDAETLDFDDIGALACGRASFSYHLLPEDLPEPCLRLTIRKLDDSYFDVQIERSAAVWELKVAIEAVFVALYDDMENAISWQHVWSHFCLCFKDEKLTDDKATLRAFGIIDGDEPVPEFQKSKGSISQKVCEILMPLWGSRTSLDDFGARSWSLLDDIIEEDEGKKLLTVTRHSTSALEEGYYVYQHHEECMEEDSKKGSFFRRWFSSSR